MDAKLIKDGSALRIPGQLLTHGRNVTFEPMNKNKSIIELHDVDIHIVNNGLLVFGYIHHNPKTKKTTMKSPVDYSREALNFLT